MLYVNRNLNLAVDHSDRATINSWRQDGDFVEMRQDWQTFEEAQAVADDLNEINNIYIATDAGEGHWPRYDVMVAPKVGDQISYSFNGDSYPDGEIVKISKSKRVLTSSMGHKYYRRGASGRWIYNGTWSMVRGHVRETNWDM